MVTSRPKHADKRLKRAVSDARPSEVFARWYSATSR
jgi:hypothetical protein